MSADGSWDTLQWRKRLEVFEHQMDTSPSDDPTLAKGSRGEIDAVCQFGELTDRGRQTTTALGQRLRDLYVSKLGLLPETLDPTTASSIYLRATPIPRVIKMSPYRSPYMQREYETAHREQGRHSSAVYHHTVFTQGRGGVDVIPSARTPRADTDLFTFPQHGDKDNVHGCDVLVWPHTWQ